MNAINKTLAASGKWSHVNPAAEKIRQRATAGQIIRSSPLG
jgi:hypothetical protein